MKDKGKIKVVKRGEAAAAEKNSKRTTSREAARQVVTTVTDWVSDVRKRRADETRAALDVLFGSKPRPSES